eukprot:1143659-Pelagomonas_calceolata.AAC.1
MKAAMRGQPSNDSGTGKKKPCIGVRFRPEVCERKAAPGDTVSVHYQPLCITWRVLHGLLQGMKHAYSLLEGVVHRNEECAICAKNRSPCLPGQSQLLPMLGKLVDGTEFDNR